MTYLWRDGNDGLFNQTASHKLGLTWPPEENTSASNRGAEMWTKRAERDRCITGRESRNKSVRRLLSGHFLFQLLQIISIKSQKWLCYPHNDLYPWLYYSNQFQIWRTANPSRSSRFSWSIPEAWERSHRGHTSQSNHSDIYICHDTDPHAKGRCWHKLH